MTTQQSRPDDDRRVGAHDPGGHAHAHTAGLARVLELDAVVYRLEGIADLVSQAAADVDVRRVLDVGAGTGTGTVALARRFPAAQVVAIDVSEEMLSRVRASAVSAGVAARVVTENVDVAGATESLGLFDVAWAALSLHEVDDPDRALENLHAALRPGGVLAVVEMDEPPRLLPDAFAGLEERLRIAIDRSRPGHVDHPDWSDALTTAGFGGLMTRAITFDEPAPGGGPVGEYAALSLERFAAAARPSLDATDVATLTALLGDGPDGVRRRADLRVRGTRTVWIARR